MTCSADSIWTDDLRARLALRWSDADRPSATKIARELGLTKNQVIGCAHRMGLPKRPSPILGSIRKTPIQVAHEPASRAIVSGILISDCKFIAADPHGTFARGENPFCGKPTLPGSSYCGAHHAVCYVRATPQRLAEIERAAKRAADEDKAA